MKVEQHFTLTIKEQVFELTKEEAEDLYYSLQSALDKMDKVYIPFQNPIPPFNEPVYRKDFEITTSPLTGDKLDGPYYSTCGDSVK
jgi:hypothetical protein